MTLYTIKWLMYFILYCTISPTLCSMWVTPTLALSGWQRMLSAPMTRCSDAILYPLINLESWSFIGVARALSLYHTMQITHNTNNPQERSGHSERCWTSQGRSRNMFRCNFTHPVGQMKQICDGSFNWMGPVTINVVSGWCSLGDNSIVAGRGWKYNVNRSGCGAGWHHQERASQCSDAHRIC